MRATISSEGNAAAIREVVVSFFLLFVSVQRYWLLWWEWDLLYFVCLSGFLTQNPNLSQGLRVEYLHNLSTRIVVVGWEVLSCFLWGVLLEVFWMFCEREVSLKGLLLLFLHKDWDKILSLSLSLCSTLLLAFF